MDFRVAVIVLSTILMANGHRTPDIKTNEIVSGGFRNGEKYQDFQTESSNKYDQVYNKQSEFDQFSDINGNVKINPMNRDGQSMSNQKPNRPQTGAVNPFSEKQIENQHRQPIGTNHQSQPIGTSQNPKQDVHTKNHKPVVIDQRTGHKLVQSPPYQQLPYIYENLLIHQMLMNQQRNRQPLVLFQQPNRQGIFPYDQPIFDKGAGNQQPFIPNQLNQQNPFWISHLRQSLASRNGQFGQTMAPVGQNHLNSWMAPILFPKSNLDNLFFIFLNNLGMSNENTMLIPVQVSHQRTNPFLL